MTVAIIMFEVETVWCVELGPQTCEGVDQPEAPSWLL